VTLASFPTLELTYGSHISFISFCVFS